ncbi:MAG: phosphatase PAP2 family protein [Ignavibacteria bacterium]|jgi:membrane-associated phospholipid phosphatase|nr:phosphatase PAP2 family protein [Ignavibacteria bacterium]
MNFVVIAATIFIASAHAKKNSFWRRQIHYWYTAPLILLTFKEIYLMIKPIRQIDYDYLLIKMDRMIFGFDPTVELMKIATPLLTELLQIIYATFYFLPMILAISLYYKKKNVEVDFVIFSTVYGFLFSYIGYLLVPAIGPRFHLHDFFVTNTELPGLFLTNFLREIVNTGESIPTGTLNPMEVVQRDVFPSGHTMMTVIIMYLSIKLKSKTKYFLIPVGTLLIFSTVYLRYHYAVDVIAGLICAIFSLISGYYIFNWWQKLNGKKLFTYPQKENQLEQ